MRLTPLRLVQFSLISLLLLLSSCVQPSPQVPPSTNTDTTTPLFDDTSLGNAQPIGTNGETEVTGQDLNNETQAIELPYDGIDEATSSSELSAQAVLAGAKGFVALYRKSGTTFEIRIYNQTNDAATTVYSGLQEVQSVAVNATGTRVVASMKNPSNNKFDVYLFKLDNAGTILNLSNIATLDETNVSMTRDASKIAWERRVSSSSTRIRPYICNYDALTEACTVTFLSSSFDQIQPSLSSNGLYLALVRVLTTPAPTRYQVLRYTFATNSYTSVQTSVAPDVFTDPSIDDTGSKIMYLWKRSSNSTDYIQIRDLLANTLVTEAQTTSDFSHPFITAEGQFATYQQFISSQLQVRTRNIATNAVAIQDTATFEYHQPFWMVPCGTGPTITGDRTLGTQADVNALAGVSKITGSLFLNPSSNLDFSPLASLTEVTGVFDMVENVFQTTLSGFECLTTVGGNFNIAGNVLQSISGFAALNSVGGSFLIEFNDALTSIPSFGALTSVGGQFNILSNTALTSVSSFAALTSVGDQFNIIDNATLTSIPGFAALTSVGGDFNIFFNNALQSITGFNLLESGRIAGTATVRNNTQLNCQTPDPRFSPVDVSFDNSVNCFTDIAVVGFALPEQPTNPSYTPITAFSYNATGGSITANRTATGTYNIVFSGLTLDANSNVQVTAFENLTDTNYCNVQSVSGNTVNVRCFNGGSNALTDSLYTIAITDKTTGSNAKVSSYVLANDKTSASYTPATDTSYNGYGGAITATRSGTGTYEVTFANGTFGPNSNVQVTALDDRAYCGVDNWDDVTARVFCFNETGAAVDSRYSLAVIDSTPPSGTTTKIVGYAFADKGGTASYTPNPIFAYNQTGFGVSAVRDNTGVYSTIFNSLDLSTNYHVQVTARGNAANYCVLGPTGPIFGAGDDVLTTCYNSAGTAANTLFSIWVVQK